MEQYVTEHLFNEDGLVCAEDYAGVMNGTVLPRLAEKRRTSILKGDGGRPIFVSRVDAEAPKGTVVIVHGFTENAAKFAELIHSLDFSGLSVLAYDQRGHGRSWRPEGVTDISLTHVDDFDEYVRDLACLCEGPLKEMPKPWLLFSHSMGGAVAGLFLEEHGGVFERAAFCAPMIAPARMGLPLFMARAVCALPKALGRGRRRMFTSKPWNGPEVFETSCAAGRARFDWYEAMRVRHPQFRNNGPSYGWTLEALNVTKHLLAAGAPERISIPVRVWTAEKDGTVLEEPQQRFAERIPHGSRAVVRGAKHEIYRSGNDVLFPWWHEVLSFLLDREDRSGSGPARQG